MIRLMDHHCGKKNGKEDDPRFRGKEKEKEVWPRGIEEEDAQRGLDGGKEKVVSFSFLLFLQKYGGDNFLLVS